MTSENTGSKKRQLSPDVAGAGNMQEKPAQEATVESLQGDLKKELAEGNERGVAARTDIEAVENDDEDHVKGTIEAIAPELAELKQTKAELFELDNRRKMLIAQIEASEGEIADAGDEKSKGEKPENEEAEESNMNDVTAEDLRVAIEKNQALLDRLPREIQRLSEEIEVLKKEREQAVKMFAMEEDVLGVIIKSRQDGHETLSAKDREKLTKKYEGNAEAIQSHFTGLPSVHDITSYIDVCEKESTKSLSTNLIDLKTAVARDIRAERIMKYDGYLTDYKEWAEEAEERKAHLDQRASKKTPKNKEASAQNEGASREQNLEFNFKP